MNIGFSLPLRPIVAEMVLPILSPEARFVGPKHTDGELIGELLRDDGAAFFKSIAGMRVVMARLLCSRGDNRGGGVTGGYAENK